ncbi:MAG TPA: metal-dependent transcriptional regulator [Candidatus Dormibacteraeota bacterium]|jgi:DtxR family Mn-dependent transcriptional regulator|nr:metal-dependent transcriptional regulator [Candidatus Dormibacteraeota bacterium]
MPGHSHSHFAESFEMYMKAIYRLEREGPGATTSVLATELGVSPASVSGMLKKLVGEGYVEHEARGDVRLTHQGLEAAVRVVRRNRLAERLLTDVLGMPWDDVHAEACILEHAITDRVEERLIDVLGNPLTCPHGHPIPPRDLSRPEPVGEPLAQADAGSDATVCGVTEVPPEMLRYLGEIGLRPGVRVRIVEKAPLGGPVTVEVAGRQLAISLELARMVLVTLEAVALQ